MVCLFQFTSRWGTLYKLIQHSWGPKGVKDGQQVAWAPHEKREEDSAAVSS
jgi:hypothetical protein